MSFRTEEILKLKGPAKYQFRSIVENEHDRFQEYYDELGHTNKEAKARLFSRLKRIAEHGLPQNIVQFKPVGDSVYEIKLKMSNGTYRVLCFVGDNSTVPPIIYLILGFDKPKKKEQDQYIEQGKRIKKDFLDAVHGGRNGN